MELNVGEAANNMLQFQWPQRQGTITVAPQF